MSGAMLVEDARHTGCSIAPKTSVSFILTAIRTDVSSTQKKELLNGKTILVSIGSLTRSSDVPRALHRPPTCGLVNSCKQ